MIKIDIAAFLVALAMAHYFTWLVRNWARERGIVSMPAGRDVHRVPVPRIGGVAIYFAVVSVVILLSLLGALGVKTYLDPGYTLMLLLPATLVFAVGLYDDLHGASPYLKLAIQGLAALLLFWAGFRVASMPVLLGARHVGTLASFAVTALWVVLITNAFNLIDGLDGLAAGTAAFADLTMFVLCLVNENWALALLTVILAGAIFGFLRYNFSPASIFLGDSGSLLLGFLLAAFSLGGHFKGPTIVAVAIPVVSLGLPVVEVGLSVMRRFMSGKPLFSADREHIHHKLLDHGLTQRQAVALLYGVSALSGLLSLFLIYPGSRVTGLVLVVVAVAAWLALQRLGYQEFNELGRLAQRTMEQKEVMRRNLVIRRTTHRLKSVHDAAALRQMLEECFAADFDAFRLHIERAGSARAVDEIAWKREPGSMATRWCLELTLVSDGREVGNFSLFRQHQPGPLMIDVNVICSEFQDALATAVRKIASGEGGATLAAAASASERLAGPVRS